MVLTFRVGVDVCEEALRAHVLVHVLQQHLQVVTSGQRDLVKGAGGGDELYYSVDDAGHGGVDEEDTCTYTLRVDRSELRVNRGELRANSS